MAPRSSREQELVTPGSSMEQGLVTPRPEFMQMRCERRDWLLTTKPCVSALLERSLAPAHDTCSATHA